MVVNSTGYAATPVVVTSLTNSAVTITSSQSCLIAIDVYNQNATVIYVQLFNSLAAGVTLGSTAPFAVIPLPASTTKTIVLGLPGVGFNIAISAAATTTATGSTAPATGPIIGTFYYD